MGIVSYTADDPYAVHLAYPDDTLATQVHLFDREQLREALAGKWIGAGQLAMGPHRDNSRVMVIGVSHSGTESSEEAAGLRFYHASAKVLSAFYTESIEAVPIGAESACIDLDRLLARLLGRVI
jgi:hypothetical protein